MKSGRMPVCCIALAIPNHSHGWPIASLKPVGLPPESVRSRSTNCSNPIGVENALCFAGETQSTPCGTPRASAISFETFAAGSTPPCPGLAPCESLISIIFTCGSRVFGELLRTERAVWIAAAEVSRSDLPNQVAAVRAMVDRDRAFAGVVVEVAHLRAGIERADRIARQRSETHRRDVEHARRIRLRAVGPDHDAEVVRVDLGRTHRVVDPFVIGRIDVDLGAERTRVAGSLRTLVDDRTLQARERVFLGIALDEVLADFRPDRLEKITDVRKHWIVAAHRALALDDVVYADHDQRTWKPSTPQVQVLLSHHKPTHEITNIAGCMRRVLHQPRRQEIAHRVPRVRLLVPGVGVEPT